MKIKNTRIIVLKNENDEIIGQWLNAEAAAQELGITHQTIYNILNGRVRRSYKLKGKLEAIEYDKFETNLKSQNKLRAHIK